MDLISKKTRYEFREYLVGYTLREIELEFDAADILPDAKYNPGISGQRRTLVEQYYHSIDWKNPKDVRKMLTVFANVLSHLEDMPDEGPFTGGVRGRQEFKSLKKWIERDGYVYSNGKLEPKAGMASLLDVTEAAAVLDLDEIKRQVGRMQDAITDDPDLAIGTAKELIESTCKTILSERHVEFDGNADIPKLVKLTSQQLNLTPAGIPDSAKGSAIIRRLLSNLVVIPQGLAELRNLYGTGHGKTGKAKGLTARHARLAAGSAAALSVFLFETHKEKG
jgi:hypothetical protein